MSEPKDARTRRTVSNSSNTFSEPSSGISFRGFPIRRRALTACAVLGKRLIASNINGTSRNSFSERDFGVPWLIVRDRKDFSGDCCVCVKDNEVRSQDVQIAYRETCAFVAKFIQSFMHGFVVREGGCWRKVMVGGTVTRLKCLTVGFVRWWVVYMRM